MPNLPHATKQMNQCPSPAYNSHHKRIPTRPMVRRVSPRHPRADIIFAAIGISFCAMFAIYIAVHMLIGALEVFATESGVSCEDKNVCVRLDESSGLWNANARAISFSKED